MRVKWMIFRHTISSVQLMHLHLSNRASHLQGAPQPLKAAFGGEDEEELQDLTQLQALDRIDHVLTTKSVQNG